MKRCTRYSDLLKDFIGICFCKQLFEEINYDSRQWTATTEQVIRGKNVRVRNPTTSSVKLSLIVFKKQSPKLSLRSGWPATTGFPFVLKILWLFSLNRSKLLLSKTLNWIIPVNISEAILILTYWLSYVSINTLTFAPWKSKDWNKCNFLPVCSALGKSEPCWFKRMFVREHFVCSNRNGYLFP